MNDPGKVLEKLGIEEVNDPETVKALETRRGGRDSKIREFLTTAPLNVWFRVPFNVGAVYRESKKLGIRIRATKLNNETYVKILERP